jgi:hypothetical protein
VSEELIDLPAFCRSKRPRQLTGQRWIMPGRVAFVDVMNTAALIRRLDRG